MTALQQAPTRPHARNHRERGFTFVELVMVVVVLGVMAVYAAPRMFDTAAFRERGFADEFKAALRLAQKSAVAANCPVTFTTTAAHYSAVFTCAAANVASPRGDAGGLAGDAPAGITLTVATVTFSGAGLRTSAADAGVNTKTLTVTGTGGHSFTAVVHATGYVE